MMKPHIVFAALAVTCCMLSPDLTAQMSGNYSINPTGSGSRNFKDFSSAIVQLWKNGMNGPVVLIVEPGNYSETVMLAPILGMSATNTLTLRSRLKHQAVFNSPTHGAIVFDLSTATKPIRGVVLDGFKFNAYSNAIRAWTPSEDVEVKNCLFPTLPTRGVVVKNVTRWNIHHCLFDNAYQGLRLEEFDACEIHHNEFRVAQSRVGIYLYLTPGSPTGPTRIYNNIITAEKSSGTGIQLSQRTYGVEISHNTMVMNTSQYSACVGMQGYLTRPTKLFSNLLVNTGAGAAMHVDSTNRYTMQLDGNLYYAAGTGPLIQSPRGTRPQWNLAAWQKLTGLDLKSMEANPRLIGGFGTPFDLRPSASSPANGKAVNTPIYVTDDYEGTKRRTPSTIGAYEASGSSFKVFGAGCPGSGNRVPKISYGGDLRLGSTNFSLIVSNALGGNSVGAFLIVGATAQTIPLGGGCNLLVSPHLVLPMTMGGTTGAGNGVILYRINLPSDPKFRGAKAHFQWGVVDSAAAGIGLAMSQGATLTL